MTPGDAARPARTVIVIPVGPAEAAPSYLDTLDSIAAFAEVTTGVLLLDDTRRADFNASVAGAGVELEVLRGRGRSGVYGGLSALVCRGLAHAVGSMAAAQVLRMDADAVMTGPGLEAATRAALAADPSVGALGSFRIGPTGTTRDFRPAAELLRRDLGRRGARHPVWALTVRRLVRAAERHGYERGEHALGAALMMSRPFVEAAVDRGWMSASGGPAGVVDSLLGDDHLLGLLTRAAGFRTADFGRPGDPLAVSWRGLPASPEELVTSKVSLVHSVKSWGGQEESDIRGRFRRLRREGTSERRDQS